MDRYGVFIKDPRAADYWLRGSNDLLARWPFEIVEGSFAEMNNLANRLRPRVDERIEITVKPITNVS